ncbi:zinc finger AN1 domain-containing stress-associated protein 12-like [Salvia miltiorrhiza]|uniref:zinc finger AN1 domain-containing stress-associated protein 12-like n=1 Tax=Salvia miltiorrhiza TaxID=226208 RepID=UPI0025AC7824|nr:zinc finger AN1 domain-containing stress-associated protein 12-like [Salvia miltiorrhiza]
MEIEDKNKLLESHEKSGDCDPRKKMKSACPVRRCKEVLTFSNTATCKTCRVKICLKYRFSADHACNQLRSSSASSNKLLAAMTGKDCENKTSICSSQLSVKAY